MKNREYKEYLIAAGHAWRYMKMRKQYFKEQTYEIQYMDKKGSIKTLLKDKITNEIIRNNIPSDPNYFNLKDYEEIKECERIRHNIKQQSKKVKEHIMYMFAENLPCFFLTLTFNDEALKEDLKKRKEWITRLLNEISEDYIINIDYGEENEREHFHAIIQLKPESYIITNETKKNVKINLLERYENKYGFYYCQPIRKNYYSVQRLKKYMNKLTLHSTKIKQNYISVKKGTRFQEYKKSQIWTPSEKEQESALIKQAIYVDEESIKNLNELFNHNYDIND